MSVARVRGTFEMRKAYSLRTTLVVDKLVMASPFLDILKYNLSGQLTARLLTFLINVYFIRYVSINLIGFINVRMSLLYTTILFLVREPIRKVCLSSDLSVSHAFKFSWIGLPYALVITLICWILWSISPLPEAEATYDYEYAKFIFAGSALIEIFTESFAVLALKTGQNAIYSFAHALPPLFQRLIAFLLIIGTSTDHFSAFCYGQILGSMAYTAFYLIKWSTFRYANDESSAAISHDLRLFGTMILHSLLKQALTDGAGYVMVFTNVLSLKMQAVYDIVEKLGSLATRLILTPLEESAFVYFSSNMKRGGVDSLHTQDYIRDVSKTYFTLLRIVLNIGIVLLTFGIQYSALAIKIYGGAVLVENDGHKMLMLYLVYLLIMAINGITECFAFASMGSSEIMSHGGFLFILFIIHMALNLVLSHLVGGFGFIIANCVNSSLRIAFNGRYISKFLKNGRPPLRSLLPGNKLSFMLVMISLIIFVASMLFESEADIVNTCAFVAIGGVLFLGVLVHLYQAEHLFAPLLEKRD